MQQRSVFLAFCLFALFLALPPLDAHGAPEAVATVVALRGSVVASDPKGVERKLATKSKVFEHDRIRTDKNGRLQLLFTDNSIISLGGASEMNIAEYRWEPAQNDGVLKTEIKEGAFRVMGGALTKVAPQNFKTVTPAATIGIRGSMYAGLATPETLSVVFQGGKGIEVTNAFGTVAITRGGFGTHVALNKPPMSPVKFTDQELKDLGSQLNGQPLDGDKEAAPSDETGRTPEEKGSDGGEQAATTGDEGQPSAPQQSQPTGEPVQPTEPKTAGTAVTAQPALAATTSQPPLTPEAISPLPPPTRPPLQPLGQLSPLTPPVLLPPVQLVPQAAILPAASPAPTAALPTANALPSAPTFTAPPGPPTEGIFAYNGGLGGLSTDLVTGANSTITGEVFMAVNWYNRTVLGAVFDPVTDQTHPGDSPVFFFGAISGNTVSNIQIFGADAGGPPGFVYDFIRGNASGIFTGAAYDFFSFTGSGSSYDIQPVSQPAVESWKIDGGAVQNPLKNEPVAPKGSTIWSGFVVASSENMADRPNGRHLMYNTNPNTFTMSVNKDTGTILGTMTTDAKVGGTYDISGLTVGGSYASAYVADNLLAALLGCSGGCIGGSSLKSHGNYLVVEDPDKQWSSYFTWGYWEAAYVDPVTSTIQRHIRVPESMWIAGELSNNSVINTSFVGSYSGKARGTKIEVATPSNIQQMDGTMNLTANFTSTPTITGNLSFTNGPTLSIGGGESYSATTSTNSFSANLTGGAIQGAFYGNAAQAVGGNFHSTTGGFQYFGIFGGNKVP